MNKYLLTFVIIFIVIFQTAAEAQNSGEPAIPDSIITFDRFINIIPDSLSASVSTDSLKVLCKTGIKMPVFNPDSEKTDSMPQYKAPKVDEGMIIPRLFKCSDDNQLLKKNK